MTVAPPDPVVLIHGAWAGAWVWERLMPFLGAAGIEALALDLPGTGAGGAPASEVSLDLCVARVAGAVARLGGRASLVAHSGGGVVASAAAEAAPGSVARIAYVAGMMLPDGMGFADLVAAMTPGHPAAPGIGPHLAWSADGQTSRVPARAAAEIFFNDCPAPVASAAAARLAPQAERGRALRARLTAGRFGQVPRLYVEASDDRAVIPALQRRMCELVPGAAHRVLPTGHVPQLSAPRSLAEALLPFLRAPAAGRDPGTPLAGGDLRRAAHRSPAA